MESAVGEDVRLVLENDIVTMAIEQARSYDELRDIFARLAKFCKDEALVEALSAVVQACTVAVMMTADDKMLLLRRNPDSYSYPGRICLPGGRVDETDEDLAEGIRREVREEVALFILSDLFHQREEHAFVVSTDGSKREPRIYDITIFDVALPYSSEKLFKYVEFHPNEHDFHEHVEYWLLSRHSPVGLCVGWDKGSEKFDSPPRWKYFDLDVEISTPFMDRIVGNFIRGAVLEGNNTSMAEWPMAVVATSHTW